MQQIPLPFLTSLPPVPTAFALACLHLGIGTVAALIAQRKGRNFRRWLGIGWICGTPSLFVALGLKSFEDVPKSDS